ncbi:glycerophosphodiester phosphodiesterase family protein [Paenibacillus puldeungensis]|uniref:Glycerophosphodiester phosphodiesterase family protein n=1 Tax=Paenibacillus puldeungensis TaxID=696536 RepID=A0ABW3RTL1_9BACL
MKRLKKLISTTLVMSMLAGSLIVGLPLPKASAAEVRPELNANRTLSAPVIDGRLEDSVWSIEHSLPVQTEEGASKESKFGMLWDYKYLYFGVKAEDAIPVSSGSGYWFDLDNINFFIDPTMHQSAPFAPDDMQAGFVFQPGTTTPEFHFGAALNGHNGKDERRILRSIQKTTSGWSLEVAIPWDMLNFDPAAVKQFGLNLTVTDRFDAADASKQATHVWSAYQSTSFWNDTTGYGTVHLTDDQPFMGETNPVLLQDDFEAYKTGDIPPGWFIDPESGTTPITVVQDTYGGHLTIDGISTSQEGRIAAPVQWDNYEIETDVRFEEAKDPSSSAAIVFRASADGKIPYHQFTIRQNGAYELFLRDSNGGTQSLHQGLLPAPLDVGKDYSVKLRAYGNNVKAYVKAEQDAAYTLVMDQTFRESGVLQKQGKIGFQADHSKVSLDNVKVTRISADRLDLGIPDTAEALTGPLSVTGSVYYSDGITEPLELNQIRFYSSDDSIIKVTDNQLFPLKEGKTTIKAVFDNLEVSREMNVTASASGVKTTAIRLKDGYLLTVTDKLLDLSTIKLKADYNNFTSGEIPGSDASWLSDHGNVTFKDGVMNVSAKGVYPVKVSKDGVSTNVWVVAKDAADQDYVLYQENFDGAQDGAMPEGWSRKEGATPGKAAVQSGAFILDASASPDNPSRVLLPDYLAFFGNYKIEADITHLSANEPTRWHSIMYRVQKGDYPYYQMAVRQKATASNGIEFAERTPASAWNVMEKGAFTESISQDKLYHYTVKAYGNRVQQFIDNKLIVDTDRADAYAKGGIGLQANGSKMKVDNIKIVLQQNPLPPMAADKFVRVAAPDTGIAMAPSVITELESREQLTTLNKSNMPATMILHLKNGLKVTDPTEKQAFGDLAKVMEAIQYRMIPAFYVTDKQTADQLISYLKEQAIEDAFVVSDSPDLVKRVRQAYPFIQGIVDYRTVNSLSQEKLLDIRKQTTLGKAKIVLLPQNAITRDQVAYLQKRLIVVWAAANSQAKQANDSLTLHQMITSGVNGIVTSAPKSAYDAYKLYSHGTTLIRKPYIIGHRGIPALSPENTIEGNQLALDYGADFIENDIYLTKDGHLIILHDGTLERTTNGKGHVRDYTLEELKKLNANKTHPNGFPDVKIPTLLEQINLVRERNSMLMAELKQTDQPVVDAYVKLIKETNSEPFFDSMSFSADAVAYLGQVMPEMPAGLLVSSISGNESNPNKSLRDALRQVQGLNATFNVGYYGLGKNFLEAAHHRGLIVSPWTINSKADFISLYKFGVFAITTDNTHWAADWADSIRAEKNIYETKSGGSVDLSAIVTTYKGTETKISPDLVWLDGQDRLKVNGTKVTGVTPGTAHLLMRYTASMDDNNNYDIYSEPVTIKVAGGQTGPSQPPSTPGDQTGGSGTPNPQTPAKPTDPNANNTTITGNTIQAVQGQVDAATLQKAFAEYHQLDVKFTGDKLELAAAGLADATRNKDNMLVAANENGLYRLPLSLLKLEALARELGGSVSDMTIAITIQKANDQEVAAAKGSLSGVGGSQVAAPLLFEIHAKSKTGKALPVAFDQAYVIREMVLDQALDSRKATAVWYSPETKQLRFVPAVFTTEGNKTKVQMKHNGNGLYMIIQKYQHFTDMANHWAQVDVELLANKLIVSGLGEGRFDGDRSITRAEFAALLVRALGLSSVDVQTKTLASYTDVPASSWFATDVASASAAGIINGYKDGSFRPSQSIKREELAAMTIRALTYAGAYTSAGDTGQDKELLSHYKDSDRLTWSSVEVAAAIRLGLMEGVSAERIGSSSYATRAQSAVMIKRLLSKALFIN